MSRPLAECGTFTAYKRHKRNGEPVDDACAAAARDQKNSRVEAGKSELSAVLHLAIVNAPPVPAEIDELAEARENLRIVKAAMQEGVPTGLAALSKQYADLVALVRRLERQSKPEVSALDQLAQRRAERLSASAH